MHNLLSSIENYRHNSIQYYSVSRCRNSNSLYRQNNFSICDTFIIVYYEIVFNQLKCTCTNVIIDKVLKEIKQTCYIYFYPVSPTRFLQNNTL